MVSVKVDLSRALSDAYEKANVKTVEQAAVLLAVVKNAEGTALWRNRSTAPRVSLASGGRPAVSDTPGLRPSATSLQPCGGSDYPPCYVAQRESGGSYTAFNPNGCGGNACYGKWQFSGAWAGRLGLPSNLASATPAQQDAAAHELWAGGSGCSNWAACG